jgi:hypothetical protein
MKERAGGRSLSLSPEYPVRQADTDEAPTVSAGQTDPSGPISKARWMQVTRQLPACVTQKGQEMTGFSSAD